VLLPLSDAAILLMDCAAVECDFFKNYIVEGEYDADIIVGWQDFMVKASMDHIFSDGIQFKCHRSAC
jgi:hypothetical protein